MMHLRITDEIRERCLREAAHEAHINDRIVTSTPQTLAEGSKKLQIAAEVVRRMMTAMDKAMKAEKDRQWAAYMEEQKLK